MPDTVYMLGAGINWSLRDFHDLHPPVANDFFEQALCHPTLGQDVYKRKLEPLFRFIRAEFGVSGSELGSAKLGLEECFHRIESARVDAGRSGEEERELELWTVGDLLHGYLAEYLSSFEGHVARFPEFKAFGQIILDESATVLTTNYDSLIESAIELASGVRREVPRSLSMSPSARGVFDEEEYGYSHFNWNRSLAYGAKFDRVQLQRAGGITLVPGDDFYRSADEFPIRPLFLKLHGSIDWFENTGQKVDWAGQRLIRHAENRGQTILYDGIWRMAEGPRLENYLLRSLMIMPIRQKRPEKEPIISDNWELARNEVQNCRRLVIGGYSIPESDSHIRDLIQNCIRNRKLEELSIIDPDPEISERVKRMIGNGSSISMRRHACLADYVAGH